MNYTIEANKKSGVVAALLNFFCPGAGYMYCGRWLLGFCILIIVPVICLATAFLAWPILAMLLIISGFLAAGRYNRDNRDLINQTLDRTKICPKCRGRVSKKAQVCCCCQHQFWYNIS